MNPQFIIELIVRARNEIAGNLQKAAAEVDKLTNAHDRAKTAEDKHAAASRKTAQEIDGARKRFEAYNNELEKGNRSVDDGVKQLQAFGREFDRLGNRAKAGSSTATTMYELGKQARAMADAMKKASADQAAAEARAARQNEQSVQRAARARKKAADDFVSDVRRELAADEAAARQFDRNLQAEESGYRRRILAIQQGRETVEQARSAERAAYKERVSEIESEASAGARAVEQRIARQRQLEVEIARAVRAQKSAATEMERDAARARVSSAAQGLRSIGVPEQQVRRTLSTAGRDNTEVVASRNISRIRQLADEQRRLANMPTPARSWLSRFLGSDEGRLKNINNMLHQFENQASKSSFSAVRLAGNLRGMLIVGVAAFFQQLVGIGVALGGTLVAVASAAVQAGAALGGALVSGAAQAVPVLGLLAAAWGRVGAVFKAVQQAQKARQASAYDDATAADKQRQAADQVRSANEALANAQRSASDAQRNLSQARADGVRQIQDLVAAEKQAQLQAESAVLAQQDSLQTLRRSLASGNVDQLAQQSLQVRSDTLSVATTGTAAARARFDATKAVRGGVEGLDSVRQAREAVQSANQQVADARRNASEARTQASETIRQTATADRLLKQMLGQLSPAERKLYNAMERVRKDYRDTFTGKGGVVESIINAFTYAVDRADALLRNKRLINSARSLANAIGGQLRHLVDFLSSPRQVNFIVEMANQAKRNLPIVESLLQNVFGLLENIARAGEPAFHAFLQFLRDMAAHANNATASGSGFDKLQSFFTKGEQYAESIIHLAGAIARLFLAIIGASAQQGANAIDSATNAINKATSWINSHRRAVSQFFAEAISSTGHVLRAIGAIGKALFQLFDPKQVKSFSDAITKTVLPSLVNMFKVTGTISKLFLDLAGNPFFSAFAQIGLTTVLLKASVGPVLAIVAKLVIGFGRILNAVPVVRAGIIGLETVTGPWALAIAGIGATLLILTHRIHNVGDALKDIIPIAVALAAIFVGRKGLEGAITSIASGLEKVGAKGAGAALRSIASNTAGGAAGGAAARAVTGAEAGAAGGAAASVFPALLRAFPYLAGGLFTNQLVRSFGPKVGLSRGTTSVVGSAAAGAGIGGAIGAVGGAGILDPITVPFGAGVGATIGGSIAFIKNFLGKGSNDLAKFQDRVRKLPDDLSKVKAGSLEALANQAKKLADRFPDAADKLKRFAKQANDAATQLRNQAYLQGVFKNLAGSITDSWQGMGTSIKVSMKEIRDNLDQNMAYIKAMLPAGSKQATDLMVKNYEGAAAAVKASMNAGVISTKKGLAEIQRLMTKAFKAMGFSGDAAKALAESGIAPSDVGKVQDKPAAHGGMGAAVGGFIKGAGQRSADMYHRVLGAGEAVLNWGHQRIVEPALRQTYGFGLDGLFKRVRGQHGQQYNAGMAGGGFVADPGTNFSYGDEPRIAGALRRLGQLLHTTIYGISGYRSPAHSVAVGGFPNDPHTRGSAADIGVGSTSRASAAVLTAALLARVGLWRPYYPAQAAEINHVELLHGAAHGVAGAVAGVGKSIVDQLAMHINTPRVRGGAGALRALVQGELGRATQAANFVLSAVGGNQNVGGGGSIPRFSGPWVQVMARIARLKHWNLGDWRWIVNAESGGDPAARNKSSGAFGLGQFLGATARAYAKFGALSHNGVDQIRAMAQYIADRYINPTRAKAFHIAHNWYETGGPVDGKGPVPAVLHGGEHVFTAGEVMRAGGHRVMYALRKMLGGGTQGTDGSFKKGGAVGYTEPIIHSVGTGGIDTQLDTALRMVQRLGSGVITSKFIDALSRSFKAILGDGGLFDQMDAAIESLTSSLATNLKLATYRVTKSRNVIKRIDTVGVADRTVTNLQRVYTALAAEEKDINQELENVSQRLRSRNINATQREYLVGIRRNLQKRQKNVQSAVADNLDSTYNAVSDAIQERATRAGDTASLATGRLDIQQRVRAMLGNVFLGAVGAPSNTFLGQQRAGILGAQADALQKAMAYATRHGHTQEAQQIQAQIDDLRAQALEAVSAGLQADADAITAQADRASARADVQNRIAAVMEAAGNTAGAFALRGQTLAQRGGSLATERDQLTALIGQAQASGQFAIVDSLSAQLDDVNASLLENSEAIRDNTAQARQAAIDAITSRGSFYDTLFSGLGNIVTLAGQISGTTNNPLLRQFLTQQGGILSGTGASLANQLLAYGIDIRGQTPVQTASTLAGVNYDQLESGMSVTERSTFENLINAIIQNTGAQETNTQSLNQLANPQSQSWQSTAWTWFRNAIFSGAGGLLPQYQNFALGIGTTPALAAASPGMSLSNASLAGSGNVFAPSVTNVEQTQDMDADTLVSRLWARYRDNPKGS